MYRSVGNSAVIASKKAVGQVFCEANREQMIEEAWASCGLEDLNHGSSDLNMSCIDDQ